MNIEKAGAVIYCTNPKPLILLLKSSNPAFGGSAWQLPKGGIDPGETASKAGFREAKEEAGLMDSDVQKIDEIGTFEMRGLDGSYGINFISILVNKPKLSGKFHYETAETKWFTPEDAIRVIRKNQTQVLLKFLSQNAIINKDNSKA